MKQLQLQWLKNQEERFQLITKMNHHRRNNLIRRMILLKITNKLMKKGIKWKRLIKDSTAIRSNNDKELIKKNHRNSFKEYQQFPYQTSKEEV